MPCIRSAANARCSARRGHRRRRPGARVAHVPAAAQQLRARGPGEPLDRQPSAREMGPPAAVAHQHGPVRGGRLPVVFRGMFHRLRGVHGDDAVGGQPDRPPAGRLQAARADAARGVPHLQPEEPLGERRLDSHASVARARPRADLRPVWGCRRIHRGDGRRRRDAARLQAGRQRLGAAGGREHDVRAAALLPASSQLSHEV